MNKETITHTYTSKCLNTDIIYEHIHHYFYRPRLGTLENVHL